MADLSEISALLRLLGVGGNCSGHWLTATAVFITVEEPDRLLYVTKRIYPVVARQHNCTWQCVERAIRSAAKRAWDRNPELLLKLAHYPLGGAPTSSEFIDILASYFLHREPEK